MTVFPSSMRVLRQLVLRFAKYPSSAAEDGQATERAVAKVAFVTGITRQRRERDTLPDHLPRERVAIDLPTACACRGGKRLCKMNKDIIKSLGSIHPPMEGRRDGKENAPAGMAKIS